MIRYQILPQRAELQHGDLWTGVALIRLGDQFVTLACKRTELQKRQRQMTATSEASSLMQSRTPMLLLPQILKRQISLVDVRELPPRRLRLLTARALIRAPTRHNIRTIAFSFIIVKSLVTRCERMQHYLGMRCGFQEYKSPTEDAFGIQ